MINLLLVGTGAWGSRYIETLKNFPNIRLKLANRYNWETLINKHPDGVIIATPPQSHVEIASFALSRGIPAMIEKPLALSKVEAERLSAFKAPILVNHIHLFSPAFEQMKKMLDGKNIVCINSIGCNIGPQRDYNPLWDYGSHDVAMSLDLLNDKASVNSVCCSSNIDEPELRNYDVILNYGEAKHHLTVGNAGPGKIRSFEVICSDETHLCYNDTAVNKLTIGSMYRGHLNYNAIALENIEPLQNAIQYFISSIKTGIVNRSGLNLGLKVVDILEECDNQINNLTSF